MRKPVDGCFNPKPSDTNLGGGLFHSCVCAYQAGVKTIRRAITSEVYLPCKLKK
jgi:hypothetical protein